MTPNFSKVITAVLQDIPGTRAISSQGPFLIAYRELYHIIFPQQTVRVQEFKLFFLYGLQKQVFESLETC